MTRKTFVVKEFKDWINDKLANDNIDQDTKSTYCAALEHVLHETGNYNGYNNRQWLDSGWAQWLSDGKPDGINGDYSKAYSGPEFDRIYA